MNRRTRTEIIEEVTELAAEVQQMEPGTTDDEAMSVVWEQIPELYEEFTSAPPEARSAPIAKSAPEPTVGDVIHEAVRKQAANLAWTQWPNKTIEDLEWEVWNSADGQIVYDLYRIEGSTSFSEARMHLGKADAYRDAWTIYQKWAGQR